MTTASQRWFASPTTAIQQIILPSRKFCEYVSALPITNWNNVLSIAAFSYKTKGQPNGGNSKSSIVNFHWKQQ